MLRIKLFPLPQGTYYSLSLSCTSTGTVDRETLLYIPIYVGDR